MDSIEEAVDGVVDVAVDLIPPPLITIVFLFLLLLFFFWIYHANG